MLPLWQHTRFLREVHDEYTPACLGISGACIVRRYGLVRVRENAESIAFYGGEGSEQRLLGSRLGAAVANYAKLLIASRNLQFFTSFYRWVVHIVE